jgi:tripartite-type tricarboxylate transporter receptor subunit TctC
MRIQLGRTRVSAFIAALVGTAALTTGSLAQEKYPSRPIDFICPWGTGGGADAMARQIGTLVQPALGVALPVSNVPGASGNTGLAQILNGKADGYAIAVYIQDTLMTIPMGLAHHKVDDLAWIVRTQVADSFLFVKTDSPFKTIQDLFRHAQTNPGKLRVASTGFGTVDDVTVRVLEKKGYKLITVPYPKPGERYAAALGGHAEILYEQAGDILQYLKAGQLRPLVIFAEKRHPAFPDVPSSRELGLDVTLPQFRGIVARKGTPPERIALLSDAVRKAMDTPQWKKFSEEWYFAPESYMGHEPFGRWVTSEVETLDRLINEFGLRK